MHIFAYEKNAINWFEIPTVDFERAVKFYEDIFDFKMQQTNFTGLRMASFQFDNEGVGGSLIYHDWYKPSENGVLIYLMLIQILRKSFQKWKKRVERS